MRRRICSLVKFAAIIILCWNDWAVAQCSTIIFSTPINSQAGNSVAGKIITGDFNSDGKIDLITIGTFSGEDVLSMMPGQGNATFGKPQTILAAGDGTILNHSPIIGLATDFNNDGILDLLIVNFRPASYQIYLGNGNGNFHLKSRFYIRVDESLRPAVPSIGDLNNDGIIDIIATSNPTISRKNGSIEMFFGDGFGKFRTGPTYDPNPRKNTPGTSINSVIGVADINGDGWTDIVLSTRDSYSKSQRVRVITGQFDGSFDFLGEIATTVPFNSVNTLLDLKRDGRYSLLNYLPDGRSITVQMGRGNGTFGPAIPSILKASTGILSLAAVADFNGDGFPDLIFSETSIGTIAGNNISIYLGRGKGTFRANRVTLTLSGAATEIMARDFNGDGRIDLGVHLNPSQSDNRLITIYLNSCGDRFTASHLVTQR